MLLLGLAFANQSVADPSWHICAPFETRHTCVADGDTLWYQGEKMRLLDIDAPERDGRCAAERDLALRATERLLSLMQTGVVRITRYGQDPYGRTLVRVETVSGQAGHILIEEGLADRFGDWRRPAWCD